MRWLLPTCRCLLVLAAGLVSGLAGGCTSHGSASTDGDEQGGARLASASDTVGRGPSDASDVYAALETPVSYPELEKRFLMMQTDKGTEFYELGEPTRPYGKAD